MPRKKSTPKTQLCTVCQHPRKFLRMREKEGKDGRTARWPEYELCPRKYDPEFHPTSDNLIASLDAEMRTDRARRSVEAIKRVAEHQKRPTGVLYQVQNRSFPLEEIADCLLHFEEKSGGKLPMAIGVRGDEADEYSEITWEQADGSEIEIPIWTINLSPKYGYIYLITELS